MSFDLSVYCWDTIVHFLWAVLFICFLLRNKNGAIPLFLIYLTFLILLRTHETDNGESSIDERDC
jgi:hypothetical protein